ncbi:MAG: 6,7-dimethyl-8-ribityllumazine synthase [Geminicoccaceae bacterium]|nr:6,7-dimethyl-8-ribityllumazine synthase [Geminicoccaceae bacterium]MCB9945629.1 6,7-dimethyl-8-ribityllumazine synthase [Geminicoccaceae bacterium]
MAGVAHGLPVPDLDGTRFLIIEARYHATINDMLIEGARAMLARGGCRHEVLSVPGALEIPPAIALHRDHGRFAGFIAVGCVIRGETTHYDLVANESCRGIMELGLRDAMAIGNGILTVENEAQAIERADPAQMDKGGHAALAAMSLVDIRRHLQQRVRG